MKIRVAVVRSSGGPFLPESVTIDAPQDDEVRVRLVAAGICHTDLSVRDGHIPVPLPAVLGHEGAGVVEEVGTSVKGVSVGDKVLMSQAFCGSCRYCRTGAVAYCLNASRLALGGRRDDGSCTLTDAESEPLSGNFVGQSSFATNSLVKARNVFVLPDDAPLATLAPLGCGVMTGAGAVLNEGHVGVGSSVAVLGCGTVGLSALLAARAAGASVVVAVDRNPQRLALAEQLGATHVLDGATVDVAAEIQRITGGGVDLAVEAAGVPALVPLALASCSKIGSVVIVGAAPQGATIELDWWALAAGRTVKGSVVGGSNPVADLPRLIDLWRQGKLPLEQMITTYPVAEINRAAEDLESGRALKPVLLFDDSL